VSLNFPETPSKPNGTGKAIVDQYFLSEEKGLWKEALICSGTQLLLFNPGVHP
jgi:hypothetical protein